jgi:short chain dehydrogenase
MNNQKSVFITGAAAGIGRATALSFARIGYSVGAYDVDEVGLKSLADEIDRLGAKAVTGRLDVTDADEMARRVAEFAQATGGRLDVMINNAGILRSGRFEDIAVTAHHQEIDVNTKGVVNGLHAAFPHLRATPGAVVVDMWPLYVDTAMTDGVKTGTTESLGIRLTAQDVANDIVKAVDPSWPRRLLHQVHFPVGKQAKASAVVARFLPAWSLRVMNKRLAQS